MSKQSEYAKLQFPEDLKTLSPKYYLASLSRIIDLTIKAFLQQNSSVLNHCKELLETIQEYITNKLDFQLDQILDDNTPYNAKMGMIQVISHEISQYLAIIQSKMRLKFSKDIPSQYPIPITVNLLLFCKEKQKYLQGLSDVIHNHQTDRVNTQVSFFKNQIHSLYEKNLERLREAKTNPQESKTIWAETKKS